MLLKPRKINIKTGVYRIAVLHEDTAHKLDLHLGDRVKLVSDRSTIIAVLDITTDESFPKTGIGLFKNAYDDLNIEAGDLVQIQAVKKPNSVFFVREKLDGKKLTAEQYDEIIKDIVTGALADIEITYFVSGIYTHNTDDEETANLIRAMLKYGKTIKFDTPIIADKHCIGGVPGNRVTPIVVPIMVAAGVLMPKTSSRAITSPAGTADAMEVVTNVTHTVSRLQTIAKEVGGFMVWGGGVQLAPADDRIIRVENPVSLDPEGMLLASIMAKKISVGATHVLIDIPVGKTVKIKDRAQAEKLKQRFENIGKMFGMKMAVIITEGLEPLGRGIGPLLEMLDVMKVLRCKKDAPQDLREKSLYETEILLELTGKAEKGQGRKMAEEILNSGKAWKVFQKIIRAQGKKRIPAPAKFQFHVPSWSDGVVREIDNKLLAHIARIAGAPKDKTAGLYIHKKLGDTVKKGEALYTIYASTPDRLKYAMEFCKQCGYVISL